MNENQISYHRHRGWCLSLCPMLVGYVNSEPNPVFTVHTLAYKLIQLTCIRKVNKVVLNKAFDISKDSIESQ